MSEQNETKSIHPTISRDFQEIFNAVEGLLANHLNTPSLILLYSAIDIAAGLASPEPGPTGQKHFVAWAVRYMNPKAKLSCTPVELYGARCGIVHGFSPASGLSRKPDVAKDPRRIWSEGS